MLLSNSTPRSAHLRKELDFDAQDLVEPTQVGLDAGSARRKSSLVLIEHGWNGRP